jgi:hypothetical protein
MSLLDDLKKQANQVNPKESEDDSNTVRKHQVNWNTLVPKLQLIITYMRELAENLNAIDLDDKYDYPLTKNVEFKNLTKENFRVRKADEKSVRDFSFRYDLVGERNIEFIISNDFNAENIRSLLRKQNARFTEVYTDQGQAHFRLKPKITVLFQYIADLQDCTVILRIHNFDRPEMQEIRYKPEAITEELMEETAKHILNKENRFRSLSGNDVDDEALQKLRSKLKKDGKIPTDGSKAGNEQQEANAKKKSILGKLLKK